MKDNGANNLQQSGGIVRYRRVVIQDVRKVPVSSKANSQRAEVLRTSGTQDVGFASGSRALRARRASNTRFPVTNIRTNVSGHEQIAIRRTASRIRPVRHERAGGVLRSPTHYNHNNHNMVQFKRHQTIDTVPAPSAAIPEVAVSASTDIQATQPRANAVLDRPDTLANVTKTLSAPADVPAAKKRSYLSYYARVRTSSKRAMVGYGLAGAAVVLLLVGIGVNVRSFVITQQVRAQTTATQRQDAAPNSAYSEEKPTKQATQQYAVAPDLPKYLRIDDIAVFARVLRVGVDTKTSAIGVPSNIFDTAWYDGSAKPGEAGTVFIDGHVSGPTQDGVFKQLDRLQKGAKIALTTGNDKQYTYTVAAIERYDVSSVDMNTLLSTYTGQKSGLVLMTCSGAYDKTAKTFVDRLVVFATQD